MAGQPEAIQNQGEVSSALHKLKQQSLILDRDLLLLEQQITQPLSIYLTLNTDSRFIIEKLILKLDGQDLLSHTYNRTERQALREGGAQLLYKAPLEAGKHKLIAYYQSNKGHQGGAEYTFKKSDDSLVLKLEIFKDQSRESRLKPLVKVESLKGERYAR